MRRLAGFLGRIGGLRLGVGPVNERSTILPRPFRRLRKEPQASAAVAPRPCGYEYYARAENLAPSNGCGLVTGDDLAACTRLSLFPMGPVRGLVLEVLRWPVAGLGLSPEGRIRTSNLALGGRVRLRFYAPRMLVILPEALLGQVVERFRGGGSQASASVMVTATASVMVTCTRDPRPSASAKLRISGRTTVRRVRPSGERKMASPVSRSYEKQGDDQGGGRRGGAARQLAFRRPRAGHRGQGLAGVGRLGHGDVQLVVVDLHLVAGGELRQIADLGPGGDFVEPPPALSRSCTCRVA